MNKKKDNWIIKRIKQKIKGREEDIESMKDFIFEKEVDINWAQKRIKKIEPLLKKDKEMLEEISKAIVNIKI